MAPSQRDGGMAVSTLEDEDESDSDTSSVVSQIFSDNASDNESASDLESDEEGSDDESDSDDDDLHDEGQLPAEAYLAIAENLNVSQLRQKRYSPDTQDKLDETREYWDRYVVLGWFILLRAHEYFLIGTAGTFTWTLSSNGSSSPTLMRRSVFFVPSSAGGAIFVVEKMVDTAPGSNIRVRFSHFGNGGISF